MSEFKDVPAAYRFVGGRRRYNAARRRAADARREAIAAFILQHPMMSLLPRRHATTLARLFGVHPTTIGRDFQRVIYPPRELAYYANGELVFTVYRACAGGPVIRLTDARGRRIRGRARLDILRRFQLRSRGRR